MIKIEDTVLVIIDVQGKLANIMHDKENLFKNLVRIARGAEALEIPIIWMEQNPEGLGPTIPELRGVLHNVAPISKKSFSCCGSGSFMGELQNSGRKDIIIVGIETHICVYQTVAELLEHGYSAHVVSDAVSSRIEFNKKIGLKKMRDAGANISSVETLLFELLKTSEHPKFKDILNIIK